MCLIVNVSEHILTVLGGELWDYLAALKKNLDALEGA